jgi:hypothetical protein
MGWFGCGAVEVLVHAVDPSNQNSPSLPLFNSNIQAAITVGGGPYYFQKDHLCVAVMDARRCVLLGLKSKNY